ncbi:MAG: glycosyl transferase [Lachnospiraceae bacterium]|nr:glycosyl transferase [Lachnospiraceae bacterium]MCM1230371.1 glycosyl transferase [Ruminococcus flavefaciens]
MNKTIHYCWFGKNPKSKLILKCIKSWKKYCPDYEIREWNEDNFDINCCDYVREAYESKKWAFVSDYCRFFVLYNYGGIYLDTDVELLKPIDSIASACVGFESEKLLNSGLVRAAEKHDKICELMLESYAKDHFMKQNGELNLLTVCERETEILCKFGLKLNNQMQVVCGTTVYPTEYFQPTNMSTGRVHITKNTVSIHHYAASWTSGYSRLRGKIYQIMCRIFGEGCAEKARKILGRKNK